MNNYYRLWCAIQEIGCRDGESQRGVSFDKMDKGDISEEAIVKLSSKG